MVTSAKSWTKMVDRANADCMFAASSYVDKLAGAASGAS